MQHGLDIFSFLCSSRSKAEAFHVADVVLRAVLQQCSGSCSKEAILKLACNKEDWGGSMLRLGCTTSSQVSPPVYNLILCHLVTVHKSLFASATDTSPNQGGLLQFLIKLAEGTGENKEHMPASFRKSVLRPTYVA